MPYPFESSKPPICVKSQFLSIIYSKDVDSIKNAYKRLPFDTRSLPSSLSFVNTDGRVDSIAAHIRWYVEKLLSCNILICFQLFIDWMSEAVGK